MNMPFMGCLGASAWLRAIPARFRGLAWLLTAALLAAIATGPAMAQSASGPLPPFQQVDGNGVDLVSGAFTFAMEEGSIGTGEARLSLMRYWAANSWTDNWTGGLYYQTSGGVTTYYVNLGPISDSFRLSGTSYINTKGTSATLQAVGTDYRYVSTSGVTIMFRTLSDSLYPLQGYSCPVTTVGSCYIPTTITQPDGMTYTINWEIVERCNQQPQQPDCPSGGTGFFRFIGVSNTSGYSFTISYLTNNPGTGTGPQTNWYKRTGVVFAAPGAGCGSSCPTVVYSTTGPLTVTDILGRTWRFTTGTGGILGIKRPGSASADTTTIAYGGTGVTTLTQDGVSWTYNRTVSGTTSTMTVTDALSNTVTIVADLTKYRVTSYQDQLLHTTTYGYDSNARPTLITAPENNSTTYHYDANGNVDSITNTGKSGSPPPTIVTTAYYPCAAPATCDKPQWTRDAKGNQTDYQYNAAGQVTVVTLPKPSATAVRPETRYGYTVVGGVSMQTSSSACQTGATCGGLADEVLTTIGYNTLLQPISASKGAGNGSLTATTTMTYDAVGNMVSTDGPLAGTADTNVYHYDLDRELVGVVGPDPDGASALKPRATRYTYNADGQVTVTEQGTVVDQSDPAWAAFTSLQQQTATYDANARAVQATATAGGTTYTLQQYSYDSLGRLDCSTTRMNSPPTATTPVCTHNSTADQIARTGYDKVGRVASVITGYDVSPRTLFAYTYTNNGQVQTVTDGNANVTTYAYDAFDRLGTTTFPNPGGGGAVTTEVLLYDANSNVNDRQLRNGAHILYAYDNLDRLTGKTLPTGNSNLNPSFTYDNLGRLITANNANTVYNTAVTFGYDALSRKVSEADGLNGSVLTKTMQYDLAGRRIRLTWPDSFYVVYDYDLADDMTYVRENGATTGVGVLAAFTYDDLGRRTLLTRGNGTTTTYGYDGISRMTSLAENLPGSGWDQTIGLGYDSGSRIIQKTSSNDAYAYPAPATPTATYPVNGLNQYLPTAGGQTTAYDPRGNLTQLGSATFSYSAENELALAGTSNRFYYDALHRLVDSTAVTSRYDRDDWDLIGLYSASNVLLRRYVFGPDPDEPLVWYEGSGTTDRRWLHADERGSVTTISNSGGGAINIDSYDEYGVPAAANTGRFQYTGQAWQSEIGMYYYKSRMYVPSLGRFAQTDPIGYDGGPNLYAYTGSDPVNYSDPMGLTCKSLETSGSLESGEMQNNFKCGNSINGAALLVGGSGSPRGGGGGVKKNPKCGPKAFVPPAAVALTEGSAALVDTAVTLGAPTLGVLGALLSLSGDTPQPTIYRHYGYAAQAGNFAGGLRPGSFATSSSGPPLTGSQAQALLALPSRGSVPDSYYNVTVRPNVPVNGPSTVAPANGQPGGGVEYTFPQGTPPGSVGPPIPIPSC